MLTVLGLFVLMLSAMASTSEETELPSLPEAVRLLQLDTINDLTQTNKELEYIINEKESQIAKLEVEKANLAATTSQLTQDILDKVLEKEQCDKMSQTKDDIIAEHVSRIAELESEKKDQLLLLANKTEEIAQLKDDFAAEKEEEERQCEAEKTHLRETFAEESLEAEANCKKAITE